MDGMVPSCIFEYAQHSEIENWIKTCKTIYQFTKKYFPEALQVLFHSSHSLDTKMVYFCSKGNLKVVKYLMSKGISIHCIYNKPLMEACRNGQLKMIQFIFSLKKFGGGTIHDAYQQSIWGGHLNVVKFIMSKYKYSKSDLFKFACESGHLNLVQYFFSHSLFNFFGLIRACEMGHVHVVEYLVSQGVDIRQNNDRALIKATMGGHLPMVQYLVSLGANVHIQNDICLTYACKIKNAQLHQSALEMVQFFVSQNLPIQSLHIERAIESGNLILVKFLIEKAPHLNTKYDIYLKLAIEIERLDISDYLVSLGASLSICYHK